MGSGDGVEEPYFGIDVVELGDLDQGVGDGGRPTAGFLTDEDTILPHQGNGPHPGLGGIVVELEPAVVKIGAHALHAGRAVAEFLGKCCLRCALELTRTNHELQVNQR